MNEESLYNELVNQLEADAKTYLESGKLGDELHRVVQSLIENDEVYAVIARELLNVPSASFIKTNVYTDNFLQKEVDDRLEAAAFARGKAKHYAETYGD